MPRCRVRPQKPRDVQLSIAMSTVLRHTAAELLPSGVRPDGFCLLDELLAVPTLRDLGCTHDDVYRVARECPKQRFEVDEAAGRIRARQGHSLDGVEDGQLLRPLAADELPPACVHGTFRRRVPDILRFGLLAGGSSGPASRRHVHFTVREPKEGETAKDVSPTSGLRHGCEVAIYIDLARALADGVPFFSSSNDVIVSPGVDGAVAACYIAKIWDLQRQCWLDLPEEQTEGPEALARWRQQKLRTAVADQVKFYFGNKNWPTDDYLRSQADGEGWVSLATVMQLNNMRRLGADGGKRLGTDDPAFVRSCLRASTTVEFSDDGLRLRRRHPLPEAKAEKLAESG